MRTSRIEKIKTRNNKTGRESSVGAMSIQHWDGCTEAIAAVKASGFKMQNSGGKIGTKTWNKFSGRDMKDAADCLAMEQSPWEKGLKIIEKMITELDRATPAPSSRRRTRVWREDDGAEVCNDRLRSGQEFWRDCRRQNTSAPATVTIIAEMATACSVSANDILWRGAAAVAMANVLENAGYRVELIAAVTLGDLISNSREVGAVHAMSAVTLKRPEQPVDLASLTNWVSGWAFRTIWFSLFNQHGVPEMGYGSPANTSDTPELLDVLTPDQDRLVVSNCWSYDDAVRVAREQLAKIGNREPALV